MSVFEPEDNQPLDKAVVEQAMLWMVALQSGISGAAEQQACQHWRKEHPQHELAWQRLTGLNRDVRDSTAALPASSARRLLQARSTPSRRTLLKGLPAWGWRQPPVSVCVNGCCYPSCSVITAPPPASADRSNWQVAFS